MQCRAKSNAARCDDVCSTLRWLMQCAASIHLKYCCEVRSTEKRPSHLSSGWQEPPFICLPDVVGISVFISAGYLSGCFFAQPKVFPSIARTPFGLPPDRFLVLSKRGNGWPKAVSPLSPKSSQALLVLLPDFLQIASLFCPSTETCWLRALLNFFL